MGRRAGPLPAGGRLQQAKAGRGVPAPRASALRGARRPTPVAAPRRACASPVKPAYLEKEHVSIATSSAPSISKIVLGQSGLVMYSA
jgi:hypothetical protein